ncbi:helix-turn-helix domain-containing protein [Roseomonas sp. CAU 1739]
MSEETLARRFTCEATPERIFFRLKHADEPPNLRNGKPAEPGTIAIGRRGAPVDDRSEGQSMWRSLSIPVAELAHRAEVLRRRSLHSLLGDADVIRPSPAAFARLARLQRDGLGLATGAPDVLTRPAASQALDEQIGEALLDALLSVTPDRESLVDRRHHAIMRKVMPFIEDNAARPIALAELCTVGGCSTKLLERLFLQAFGQTPNRYLRLRRLWGARRALESANPREATVSQIALAWGFWELGRFAVAYRDVFGESPSHTLRRETA